MGGHGVNVETTAQVTMEKSHYEWDSRRRDEACNKGDDNEIPRTVGTQECPALRTGVSTLVSPHISVALKWKA